MQRSHEMCTRTEKGGEIDTVGALWCGVFSQQLHQQIRLERSKKKTETATAINAETASAGAAAAACAGSSVALLRHKLVDCQNRSHTGYCWEAGKVAVPVTGGLEGRKQNGSIE